MTTVTYDVTGTGPVLANGSQQVFCINSNQYFATAAQLTAFGRSPVPGDQFTDNGNGTITLIANPGTIVPDVPNGDPSADGGDALNPVLV